MNRTGDSARAARYPIKVLVHYRVSRESVWHEGMTENISATGVLFRCEAGAERSSQIEMNFILPIEISGERGAEVVCRGHIVRTELLDKAGCVCAMAAKISDYRLKRESGLSKERST